MSALLGLACESPGGSTDVSAADAGDDAGLRPDGSVIADSAVEGGSTPEGGAVTDSAAQRDSTVDGGAVTDAAADGDSSSDGGLADSGTGGSADSGGDADAAAPSLVKLTNTSGWQIYPGGGYRYGPSILVDATGTIHMWTCSPGANGAWDYIRYRSSVDSGHTWTADVVALQPTPGTRDAYSTCDPGAIKIGAYFYVGYGSTEDPRGTNGQVYVARSTSPSGPFDKWNGSGWGGAPQPILTYSGDPSKYGAGEPSLVMALGKLWVFYTYVDAAGYTNAAYVDGPIGDDWPAHLIDKGHVLTRRANGEDSTDVKWADALGRFVGVTTYDRFGVNATVGVYQSYDGLAFEPAPFMGARVQQGAHNIGISGDTSGHIDVLRSNFIAYAYQPAGNTWGNWPTFLDMVALTTVRYGTTVGGSVSSTLDWNWSGPRACDGDSATVFASAPHAATETTATEWAAVDLGSVREIDGVTIVPRANGVAFPVDFSIQTSNDGAVWTDVPNEQQTGFANPGSTPVVRTFVTPAHARWLRVLATKLGTDEFGNRYLQLAEITPNAK